MKRLGLLVNEPWKSFVLKQRADGTIGADHAQFKPTHQLEQQRETIGNQVCVTAQYPSLPERIRSLPSNEITHGHVC